MNGPVSVLIGAGCSKWMAFKWSIGAGLFELVGAFIVAVFFVDMLTPHIMDTALSAVAGVMVVLCFTEILPELMSNGVDPQVCTQPGHLFAHTDWLCVSRKQCW